MKIAVFDLTGDQHLLPAELPRVGQQIIDWLKPSLPEASFTVYDVAYDVPLPDLDMFDGVVLSGSELGVYDTPRWMPALRAFLPRAKAAEKPIYGICFGHQLMADVFGGKAGKADIGTVVGAKSFDYHGAPVEAYVWHGDQVSKVPPGATVTASAGYCPVGALDYDFPAKSVQFHPEHTAEHLSKVFDVFRGTVIPADLADAAEATFAASNVQRDLAADEAAEFFRQAITTDRVDIGAVAIGDDA